MRHSFVVHEVPPAASRLTHSLRDVGYDSWSAIADLVDNSLSAGASNVAIDFVFDGPASSVTIADDGHGMTASGILEALRFGTRRSYGARDLGRFGLGLKTASLSQARRLSVSSRRSPRNRTICTRAIDLDVIQEFDAWLITEGGESLACERAEMLLREGPGTVVVWEDLDRIIPERHVDYGWGKRRLSTIARRTREHLGMVFHRFLSGDRVHQVTITVNGEKVEAWDPFATSEEATKRLPSQSFEIEVAATKHVVTLERHVLPPRSMFSSPEAFERLSGPLKWNRQQGLYIYRADRLIQYGGWNGLRATDEHTKLARAALDFGTDLDEQFQINVPKMRINLPAAIKQMLERPLNELCSRADDIYRTASGGSTQSPRGDGRTGTDGRDLGLALRAAALEAGHTRELQVIIDMLEKRSPLLSRQLGFTT